VHGYADPTVAPWLFQIDDGVPEALSVLPRVPCRIIKDVQDLPDGNHRVVVTPQSITFVLTMFKYVSFNSLFRKTLLIFPQCYWTGRQPVGDKHDAKIACI